MAAFMSDAPEPPHRAIRVIMLHGRALQRVIGD